MAELSDRRRELNSVELKQAKIRESRMTQMAIEATEVARTIRESFESEAFLNGEGEDDGTIDLGLHNWDFIDAATQIVVAVWVGKEHL